MATLKVMGIIEIKNFDLFGEAMKCTNRGGTEREANKMNLNMMRRMKLVLNNTWSEFSKQ